MYIKGAMGPTPFIGRIKLLLQVAELRGYGPAATAEARACLLKHELTERTTKALTLLRQA